MVRFMPSLSYNMTGAIWFQVPSFVVMIRKRKRIEQWADERTHFLTFTGYRLHENRALQFL